MNQRAVVDRQTQTLLTMPIYVADENMPARTAGNALTPRLVQRGMRAVQLPSASRDFQLEALASDAG